LLSINDVVSRGKKTAVETIPRFSFSYERLKLICAQSDVWVEFRSNYLSAKGQFRSSLADYSLDGVADGQSNIVIVASAAAVANRSIAPFFTARTLRWPHTSPTTECIQATNVLRLKYLLKTV
jgi:hypothetical protein